MIKSIILFVTLITVYINVNSQDYKKIYLGEDYLNYKGAFFKLMENPILGLNNTFYSDLKYCIKAYDKTILYPEPNGFNTSKDSLANRIFKVEDIISKDGNSITGNSYTQTPIFKLKDTLTKQIIYFIYDQTFSFNFPFLTSPIKLDKNAICEKIIRKIDDFTGAITINSPFFEGSNSSDAVIFKEIKNGKATYDLNLTAYGSTVSVDGKGVIILFEDGTKINKTTQKVDVKAKESNFEYSVYITLSPNDLILLKTKKIAKFRLYIYDRPS
jgi:hypothetical protein